jgi:cellulose synthase/poly-beta-1,6-N-acetylglucosamine synthase-like glycosyltransferase
MVWVEVALSVASVPALAASLYLGAAAILARRQPSLVLALPRTKFDVVVPAHNEEAGIARTVASLLAVDYPQRLFRIFVVADNCADCTAERAMSAGARVIVRLDPDHRGKGFALAYAFDNVLAESFADAVVVVDADTIASSNLLSAFAERLQAGAAVVQADYGVLNPDSSWRTRLMTIAFAAFHSVRSLSRERLRLSCGLRGNGMAFSRAALMAVRYEAFSIVEDLEYGVQLGLRGIRVEYAPEARVLGQMVSSQPGSRSQRARWENGRAAVCRRYVIPLLAEAWRRRDGCLLDLAADLLVPPLAQLVTWNVAGVVLTTILAPARYALLGVWALSCCAVVTYVLRACALSGIGLNGTVALFFAPAYIVWKMRLRFFGARHRQRKANEWIRTAREIRP